MITSETYGAPAILFSLIDILDYVGSCKHKFFVKCAYISLQRKFGTAFIP